MKNYWLVKSEPDSFSLADLRNSPNQTSCWDGVRNYQARNYMRDTMQVGDQVFFYHSNCKPPGIVGIAVVASPAYVDYTAFDPSSEHPDPQSTHENPRWFMVDVSYVAQFEQMISLDKLKTYPQLHGMQLLRPGNRLSVLPIQTNEWNFIMGLSNLLP